MGQKHFLGPIAYRALRNYIAQIERALVVLEQLRKDCWKSGG